MKKELVLLLFICPLVFFYVFSNNLKKSKVPTFTNLTLHHPFEELEGSGTDDWGYIQTKRDYKDIEYYKTLYRKKPAVPVQLKPDFQDSKNNSLDLDRSQALSFKLGRNYSDLEGPPSRLDLHFWTDRKRPPPCREMQVRYVEDFNFLYLKEKFEESKNWGEKSDIWRYEILYQLGGIYIDHDAKCLRPFHGLNTGYDFYACLEMPHEGIDDLAVTAGIGIIGAKPHHPVMKEAIMKVLDRWDSVTANFSSTDPLVQARRVVHRTLIAMTHAFSTGLNHPENTDIIFPACYFYPKHGLPGFYSEHLYGTTWHDLDESPNERYFLQSLRSLRGRDAKIIRVELFSLLALMGCFVLYVLINREIKKGES